MTLNGSACYHQLSMGERSLADLARTLAEAGDILLVDDAWFWTSERWTGVERSSGWNMAAWLKSGFWAVFVSRLPSEDFSPCYLFDLSLQVSSNLYQL